MLPPQSPLTPFVNENWLSDYAKSLHKLPAFLKDIASALILTKKPIRPDYQELARKTKIAFEKLNQLESRERLEFFQTFHPQIGHCIEAAWHQFHHYPYLIGNTRRAFRAPNNPELITPARNDWLLQLLNFTMPFPQPITWFAEWGTQVARMYGGGSLGLLLAGVITSDDKDADHVFETLTQIANGTHPTGMMGRHVTTALLAANRPAGWDVMEQLLLAAQREEGLRQVILETVDFAHPEPFRRMTTLVEAHDLTRFNSAVRAIGVWFGLPLNVTQARVVRDVLQTQTRFVSETAVSPTTPLEIYLHLMHLAFTDVMDAIAAAQTLLQTADNEQRQAIASFLQQAQIVPSQQLLLDLLQDEDLVVASIAAQTFAFTNYHRQVERPLTAFDKLTAAFNRFPAKKRTDQEPSWYWNGKTATQSTIAAALYYVLGNRPLTAYVPFIDASPPHIRSLIARQLKEVKKFDAAARALLFKLLGDRSSDVQETAVAAAAQIKQFSNDECTHLEAYLTRKAANLRRGVIRLLLNQQDNDALESAARLLASKNQNQREAGLEMLCEMKKVERSTSSCAKQAESYRTRQHSLTNNETTLLNQILEQPFTEVYTLADGLGLVDDNNRTPVTPPKKHDYLFRRRPLQKPTVPLILKSLDDLIETHKHTPVQIKLILVQEEQLLGNLRYLPTPSPNPHPVEDPHIFPLREMWVTWWQDLPANWKEDNNWGLIRALSYFQHGFNQWDSVRLNPVKQVNKQMFPAINTLSQLQYGHIIKGILSNLIWCVPTPQPDMILDAVEHSFAIMPRVNRERKDFSTYRKWLDVARLHKEAHPDQWHDEHEARLWRLLRWLYEPWTGCPRHYPNLEEILTPFVLGIATEADLIDYLIVKQKEKEAKKVYSHYPFFRSFSILSHRQPDQRTSFANHPQVQNVIQQIRERTIEIELQRGELATAATALAMRMQHVGYMDTFLQLLHHLGKGSLVRTWVYYREQSRNAVFSKLIQGTLPKPEETPEQFAAALKQVNISEKRLVEAALLTPQWASHIEHAIQWPGLEDAVWWFHAHTKDYSWRISKDIQAQWIAQISEHTPLTAEVLTDGAVDVAWFKRAYAKLGADRWVQLHKGAKYCAGGNGHRRAQLYSEAMLGQVSQDAVMQRMHTKRHQDSVRALGLLPLPSDHTKDDAVLERYLAYQTFLKASKKFGSQRRTNEKRAVEIGLENLARTAGFPDPLRLQWMMERHAVADLADGAVCAEVGETAVTLSIDFLGNPQIEVKKKERRLKNVPARLKKQPEIATLLQRKRDIKQQASRVRASLEEAMIRGDQFWGHELQGLMQHPVLKPMLQDLIFVGEDVIGYPDNTGLCIVDARGLETAVSPTTQLRIAHPYDLYQTDDWATWQQECFRRERIQPFKQVFRELYLLTPAERAAVNISNRYTGQQVHPKQSLGLLGKRGWIAQHEMGISRTFHKEQITAWLELEDGFYFGTPADVGGWTISGVSFSRSGRFEKLPLSDLPPRLFSTVMRDLDLVVSVAHLSGVDPESSTSSIEMRAALVRETAVLLKFNNVELKGERHVAIQGKLRDYTIHLGSGVVHQLPGGYVCIVPVHAQHRGRLFLPFVDDDPKTAEILSKMTLLARDDKIKDPSILEQILR